MNEQQTVGESEKLIRKLRRELLFTRIMCLITSALTILLLAGGAYLLEQAKGIMMQIGRASCRERVSHQV